MKATRTNLAMLACLSAGAVHANPGALGGLDSRLESIPDNSFSTTTRLAGEVIFGGAFGESDSVGEATLFTDRARLNFSSSFTGTDRLQTRLEGYEVSLSGAVGYTENQQEVINNGDESFFYNAGARVLYGGSHKNFSYTAGLGAGATYYDNEVNRFGDDSWIGDFDGGLAFRWDIVPALRVNSTWSAYYGGHADVGRKFVRIGVYGENYFYWNSSTLADYRFDGLNHGDQGLEWSTEFNWGGLANEENDTTDNYSLGFRQEGRYNFAGGTTIFAEGSYGMRSWDEMGDWDSHKYRFGGGVRGNLGEHLSGEIKAGYELRDYDENSLNDDEQDEVYVEGLLTGQWDSIVIGIYAAYGIQEFNGEGAAGLDPVGIRGGIRGVYAYNETTRFTTDWNYTTYQLSDVVFNSPDDEWLRWACGIGCEHDFNDRLTIGVGGSLVLLDDDNDDNTYFTGTIRTKFRF